MKESIYDNMTRCEREVAELLKNKKGQEFGLLIFI